MVDGGHMGRRSYRDAGDRLDAWHEGQPTRTAWTKCTACDGRGIISDIPSCPRERMRRIGAGRPMAQGTQCEACGGTGYVKRTKEDTP